MTKNWSLTLPIILGIGAIGSGAEAQPPLTAVILHGASSRPGSAQPGTPTLLTPGVRIESPWTSWTEIAFSDGSSVVLDPGADFTLQGIDKDPESGRRRRDRPADRARTAAPGPPLPQKTCIGAPA